ncbi:alpha-galactosidase [Opitutaceae bacterium TAV1]|nr:alpha-galactosidase [Opitutaceae bacterium TAV1]
MDHPSALPPGPSAMSDVSTCHASLDEASGLLTLGNRHYTEAWLADAGGHLTPHTFRHAGVGNWLVSPPADLASRPRPWKIAFSTRAARLHASEALSLVAELRLENPDDPAQWRLHRFRIFPDIAGSLRHVTSSSALSPVPADRHGITATFPVPGADGIEIAPNGRLGVPVIPDAAPPFVFACTSHLLLRDIQLVDQTDHHANLVATREWLMHPSERCLPLRTNLVCLEDPSTVGREGLLFLLIAPLPHVRTGWSGPYDFLFENRSGVLTLRTHPGCHELACLAFAGGQAGITRALHALQRALHEWNPARDGLLLSNTWGDRAGAKHLSESFVLNEITTARDLGIEVVQIDDGWQKGDTVNTVSNREAGGVWNGFWAADPLFWEPHPERFPRGLAPLAHAAREAGVQLGLWYAPDSVDDFANWKKDAGQLLRLWREHGVRHFKLDAVKLRSAAGEQNLHALCDHVQDESGGEILFDFDATAEHRPGWWGRLHGGPVFMENRYTDWGNYFPGQTLRSLWSLSAFVIPQRIRVEFLNPSRNANVYGSSPLRPDAWPSDWLLAITLPASPLAWCELSRLPPDITAAWRPLIATWKKHRTAFHAGAIHPVGCIPDGYSWTGFVSIGDKALYALIFREITASETTSMPLPIFAGEAGYAPKAEVLAGEGESVLVDTTTLRVRIPASRRYLLARFLKV